MKWKFYIISVKDCDRREHCISLQKKLGHNSEIIDAYYWKTHDVVGMMQDLGIDFSSGLSRSQIGCFLSHREAWKKIALSDEQEYSIIIEDDMDTNNNYDLSHLEKDFTETDFDCISMWKHPERIPSSFEKYTENLIHAYKQWGTCVYCIRPKICQELLNIKYFPNPLDDFLYGNIYPNKKVYFTKDEMFVNLGILGGYEWKDNFKFKSLIWR